MKFLLAAALAAGLTGQSGEALGYACNNNYYVNSCDHYCSVHLFNHWPDFLPR